MSTQIDAEMAVKLRQAFKVFNKFMFLMWRLGFGPWFKLWPEGWGQIMVLTHTGRKSGQVYRTPVNYAVLDGSVYCIAGFGRVADWYRNLLVNPAVEVWLPDGWWQGVAEDVSAAKDRPQIMRAVVDASGFAGPMFGVDPKKLDDTALLEATRSYKVVRVDRQAARTGPGGPGDLAWVWQLATLVLLPLVFRRRRRS
jgi:deazaflavin-dependent oxidoreductase (nitroreductase family)